MGETAIVRLSVTRLLDINVLLAMAWPQHVHHASVRDWLFAQTAHGRISIASCPLTQLGFLRVSMSVKGYAADFESARSLLVHLINHSGFEHSFWPDDLSLLSSQWNSNIGPQQLADVYLSYLVTQHDGSKLATFDARIRGFHVELIPQ